MKFVRNALGDSRSPPRQLMRKSLTIFCRYPRMLNNNSLKILDPGRRDAVQHQNRTVCR